MYTAISVFSRSIIHIAMSTHVSNSAKNLWIPPKARQNSLCIRMHKKQSAQCSPAKADLRFEALPLQCLLLFLRVKSTTLSLSHPLKYLHPSQANASFAPFITQKGDRPGVFLHLYMRIFEITQKEYSQKCIFIQYPPFCP